MKLLWAALLTIHPIVLGSFLTCYDSKLRTYVPNDHENISAACRVSFNYQLQDCTHFHNVTDYMISAGLVDISNLFIFSRGTKFPVCVRQTDTLECLCTEDGCNLKPEHFFHMAYAVKDGDRAALRCVIDRCSVADCSLPSPLSDHSTGTSFSIFLSFTILPIVMHIQ